jgi:hypothetical protein
MSKIKWLAACLIAASMTACEDDHTTIVNHNETNLNMLVTQDGSNNVQTIGINAGGITNAVVIVTQNGIENSQTVSLE